jgi:hypothetical protein
MTERDFLIKGEDDIPNGEYILLIRGQNWPVSRPYRYSVTVSDGNEEQWVEFEDDYIHPMSWVADGSTFIRAEGE